MKSIDGIDTVDVNLNKGLATMTFKPGSAVTMKQLRNAIAKNGFTTKQSTLVVDGVFGLSGNGPVLKASGSGEVFQLSFAAGSGGQPSLSGKTVTVEGTLPEAVKGKADSIAVSSI